MAKILPHEIPPQGARQDMTIEKVGTNKNGDYLFKLIIDNGEHRGKRLTVKSGELLPVFASKLMQMDLDFADFNKLRPEDKVRDFRISALVHHEERRKVDGEWHKAGEEPEGRLTKKAIMYELTDFRNPDAPDQVASKWMRDTDKFTRR